MCVIAVMDGTRPSEEQVEQMYETNSSGAGIAWREDTPKGVVVRWRKGLKLGEIQDLIKTVPLPAIAHFRIPTCGGDGPEMCHPFQVDPKSSIELGGATKGYMLFHNGHWGQWKSTVLETAIKTGKQLPGGRWSDSRGMAWVASIYGIGALELIDEKCAVISPTNLEVFGNGWTKVTDGLWTSNKNWEGGRKSYSYGGNNSYHGTVPASVVGSNAKKADTPGPTVNSSKVSSGDSKKAVETKGEPGGASPEATFRSGEQPLQDGKDQPNQVEEGQEGVQEGHESHQAGEPEKGKTITPVDDSTVVHSLETEEDRVKALEFVRSLNPSRFRRPVTPDSVTRVARQDAARKGIIHLGKL